MLCAVGCRGIISIGVLCMKLWYDRKSKNPMYFVQMGIRNGKKVTTKNIERIGKHNDLLQQGISDPLSYAKEYVENFNKRLNDEKIDFNVSIDFKKKLVRGNETYSKSLNKNIGYLYLQWIYQQLGCNKFFDKISQDRKITFDMDLINRFLISARALYPGSKLATVKILDNFIEEPVFDHQHVLRYMDILEENYDAYLEHLFNTSNNVIKRNTSVCYFDCTNFYFEKEEEDEDQFDEVTGELIKGLLKYGVSKEHRPNPIVQMGLFMDGDGIPLSMCINSGSDNESLCAVPAEKKLLNMFKDKDIIYCSDAGLGYTNTRVFNSFQNRKFIVTQSIRKLSDIYKTAIFNDIDYRYSEKGQKASLKDFQSFDKTDPDNLSKYNGFIYKSFEVSSLVDLGLSEVKKLKNGKSKKVKSKGELKQRIIVTYSRKMAEYQKKIRERQYQKAADYLKHGDLDSLKKNQNDFRRFIKKEDKSRYSLNQELKEEESRYDGFYAIATNIFDEDERDILRINSRRYKIEDCFRVMKTHFDTRPINHRLPNRIKAHFLICYTALLVYRLLEIKLDRDGKHYTADEILKTLKNMCLVNNENQYYQATYTGSDVLDSLNRITSLSFDKKYYQPKELHKIIRNLTK